MTAPLRDAATQRVSLSRDLDLMVWRESDLGDSPDRFALVPRGATAGAGPWTLGPDDLTDIRAVSRAASEAALRRGTLPAALAAILLASVALAAILVAGPFRSAVPPYLAAPIVPAAATPAAEPRNPPPAAATASPAPPAQSQPRERPERAQAQEPVSVSATDWLRQRRGIAGAQQGEN